MSDTHNHTDIDDLVELHNNPSPFLSSGSPEGGVRVSVEAKSAGGGGDEREEPDPEHETVEFHETIEHEPDPEVAEFVDVRPETVEVPPDIKKIGVQATPPQHFAGTQKVQLPITDDQILQGKKAPITSSLRWLAEFCIFLLKRAHIQLKIAHGKAQRVFKQ